MQPTRVLALYLSPLVLAAVFLSGYSFAAIRKSLGGIDSKNMFDPIEGPYAGPNTRLGLERHCPSSQPWESTRAPRQLLRCCGVSFICT